MPFEAKICEPKQLRERAGALERPLVFTNGVFDILHRGHATYLEQARALGRSLVVALARENPHVNDRALPGGLGAALGTIVGERGLVLADRDREAFENDWRGQYHGRAAAVVRPASTGEVARVVTLLSEAGVGIV